MFYQDLPVLGLSSSGRSHYYLFLSNSALSFLKAQLWAGTVLHVWNIQHDTEYMWKGWASISHRSDCTYGTVATSKREGKLRVIYLSVFLRDEWECGECTLETTGHQMKALYLDFSIQHCEPIEGHTSHAQLTHKCRIHYEQKPRHKPYCTLLLGSREGGL